MRLLLAGFFLLCLTLRAGPQSDEIQKIEDGGATYTIYLGEADRVYWGHVASLGGNKINFIITKALRGPKVANLTLSRNDTFHPSVGEEGILISESKWRKRPRDEYIGRDPSTDHDVSWLYARIVREGDQIYVQGMDWKVGEPDHDKQIGKEYYLTLKHFLAIMDRHS